ncbi:cytidylate kinase [Phycicoccus badiiscoriae]|uniref:Cytidylate kinase n=1 Tax=Pedococcus badiiscoriae TaxID=642776 RepID=A0A852WTP6_9MICO|nr:(d)CMP kinase [Pedococcus badiiscoriae]NYG08562.1 cytidylate kinase [Pedococcus badiiscoriae]
MNSTHLVVAVDGPSGSGKSSVSRAAATALGVGYLDTGAMYRAVTWWCLAEGVDLLDQQAVAQATREIPLEMGTDPARPSVVVSGREIEDDIRTTRVSEAVSKVATNTLVRPILQQLQRELIDEIATRTGGVVAEGRDITTVVAPDADVRILLTASVEARLRRRSKELHGHAAEHAVEATRDQIVRRDADDSTVSDFMEAAEGVTLVDTSDLDFDQSVQALLDVVRSEAPDKVPA